MPEVSPDIQVAYNKRNGSKGLRHGTTDKRFGSQRADLVHMRETIPLDC